MTTTPDSLFQQLTDQQTRQLPPVEKWDPERVGHSDMRIDADGRWFYQGSEIQRPEMVRLFSTILRRDDDKFFLVTPAERLEIEVEDAPFVAVDMESRGEGRERTIVFRTNVDEVIAAGEEHPITVAGSAESPRPYLHIRRGLNARIGRSVYYRLIQIADHRDAADGEQVVGLWSNGAYFELGRYGA
jgi:uncharacterized protein